jgi:hypothetical protein
MPERNGLRSALFTSVAAKSGFPGNADERPHAAHSGGERALTEATDNCTLKSPTSGNPPSIYNFLARTPI